MPYFTKLILFLLCLMVLVENRKPKRRRWTGQLEVPRPSHLYKKNLDMTKIRKGKPQPLLRVEDHDFTMRPAFGGEKLAADYSLCLIFLPGNTAHRRLVQWGPLECEGSDLFPACLSKLLRLGKALTLLAAAEEEGATSSMCHKTRGSYTSAVMTSVTKAITVTAMCNMDFTHFPLDSQTCSLELESYAYTDEDLMLYWMNGDESLKTDEKISLSQFLIQKFHTTSRLAFYSSTGWYNRLYINFTLRRHIFFFLLQTYFPATLMVMLSWVSFWIDRRAVPARVSLGINTVLTMSTIITGVNASMPRVSYIKAVDIYLWVSFVFVFLSVLEYAAVNYLTTVQERKERKLREKFPCMCGMLHLRTMMLDGSYSESEANSLAGYLRSQVLTEEESQDKIVVHLALSNESNSSRKKDLLKGQMGLRLFQNTHAIDKYSRLIFPASYIFFNLIYWSVFS
ncbi:gamma-aminobutyric acid receptor subunit rho-2 [Desmodus rotundus]|uniref:gamma-aminobutyric acid receptor subunit rho-2 n=1 Tax=Desmodus rotundus TaxID=9430 RepID=UPI002380EFB2|nr:gamma-aminobutyric acid receptor subunit rho-2 [Desmodus rotundus]